MTFLRWSALLLGAVCVLSTSGAGKMASRAEKPDLIVSDLTLDGDDLVLEVQNQGPGKAPRSTQVKAELSSYVQVMVKDKTTGKDTTVRKPVSTMVSVTVPEAVMATEQVKVPIKKFGVENLNGFSPLITVTLDPDRTLADERPDNNTYYRQLDFTGKQVTPPRGDYKSTTELPDLVVTDITQTDRFNLVVHYGNMGKGCTGGDFLISIKCGDKSFPGNQYYRFRVPAPGVETKSGGFNFSLIGLKRGDEAEIEATIDWEDRVRETDKKNNTVKKTIVIE
jgi:hypothetical protein